MNFAGGLPGAASGFPTPLRAAHAWPKTPCVGDLIPAAFELIDAGGRRYRAAVLRGIAIRLHVPATQGGSTFELVIDARGRVLEVRVTPPPDSRA